MDRAKVIFNVDQNSDISKNLVDFRYQFLIEKVVIRIVLLWIIQTLA